MQMLLLAGGLALAASLQTPAPLTRAEATDYRETSTVEDAHAFVRELQRAGAPLRFEVVGKSVQGRDIALVVCSTSDAATPSAARRLGRVVVYIQANIHGGEVEGKEASLMLLRDLAANPRLLDRLVLLVCPVYNTDGNDDLGDGRRNRPSQNGPERVGQRTNGQGLDLNRDAVKAESPEMKAVLDAVYNRWDPDVMVDLHTTNGTRHGYQLTYSPPLNPNTDPGILSLSRDVMLPQIRTKAKRERAYELFDYGNLQGGGWYAYGQEGRYVTNYVGLRNRIAVLSEATSYLPFRERVMVTKWFVDAVVQYAYDNAEAIRSAVIEADRRAAALQGHQLGVRFDFASRGVEGVLLEKQGTGQGLSIGEVRSQQLDVFDRFRVTTTATMPAAWILPADATSAADVLARHGIIVERTTEEWSGPGEWFEVSSLQRAHTAFQGHRLVALEGRYIPGAVRVPEGSFLVRSSQPLARLAFHMLEAQSLDGVIAWELVPIQDAAKSSPILRLSEAPKLPTVRHMYLPSPG
ncbi:MAG: hypothetical protein C4341_08860 [Armatimonadota bacterium]